MARFKSHLNVLGKCKKNLKHLASEGILLGRGAKNFSRPKSDCSVQLCKMSAGRDFC